jgi:hypothetical protein
MNIVVQNITQILILVYIIVSFGYSAIEKILQHKESIEFYSVHFKKTFLKNYIPSMLNLVIVLELITVITCVSGLYFLLITNEKQIGLYGLILAAITLIGLMIGQRIAQDYSGAMNITIYFILTVFGVYLFQ